MTAPSHWPRAGRDWPHRERSEFVRAGGIVWHVQTWGKGPVLLLLHGTGSATHTWNGLLPRLVDRFRVVAVDLPGHGFTDLVPGTQATLPGMANLLSALLDQLDIEPALAVGHSAGAAILVRLCLDRRIAPAALISLNGAFVPFGRMAAPLFSGAARLLAASRVVPYVVAIQGLRRRSIENVIEQTGSRLEEDDLDNYRTLIRQPRHISGTLRMMANWDLESLWRELPQLTVPLVLVACDKDLAVKPVQAERLVKRVPKARLLQVADLGHLGHEEQPEEFAEIIKSTAREYGLLRAASA
ncbi:MAG: alpha/beta fold hydrolase BchO [Pseudomonadota bacterium]